MGAVNTLQVSPIQSVGKTRQSAPSMVPPGRAAFLPTNASHIYHRPVANSVSAFAYINIWVAGPI
jgi:hypothetical protein